jgi:hypothetical protein
MYALQPRLPAELTDMVLDHLSTDVATLRTAAVVSKAWLPRSRVHLFHKVRTTTHFAALLRFLEHTPHVRPYIRCLVLDGPELYDDIAEEAEPEPGAPTTTLPPHLLAEILARVPRLNVLQLQNVSLHDSQYDDAQTEALPSTAAPPRRTLDVLQLMNVGSLSDTRDDVFRVLGLFSEIRFLHLDSVAHTLQDPRTSTLQLPLPDFRVHALKLADTHADVYYEAIRATNSRDVLKRVEVECSSVEHAVSLAAFLEYAGPALEHLAVDFTHCFRPSEDVDESEEIFMPGELLSHEHKLEAP